jgi:hypothetical protein
MNSDCIAYPISEGFIKIGIPPTAGYRAITAGDLQTFKVGKRREVIARSDLYHTKNKLKGLITGDRIGESESQLRDCRGST